MTSATDLIGMITTQLRDWEVAGNPATPAYEPEKSDIRAILLALVDFVRTAGASILTGTGAPSDSYGADGDLYLDRAASVLYGPKAGTWGTGISLVGAVGSASSGGAFSLSASITPAQITADQSNYNPAGLATASVLFLSTDQARTLGSMVFAGDGDIKAIVNVGSSTLTVASEGAGQTSRRFHLPSDVVLRPSECLIVRYDAGLARWRSWGGWRDPADPIAQQAGLFDLSGEASSDGLTYTASAPSSVTAYVPGRIFIFTPPVTNAGATLLNINGIGALPLSDARGVALLQNTIVAGQPYFVQQFSTTSLRLLGVNTALDSGAFNLSASITPPQITADQVNYSPTGLATASVLFLDTDQARSLMSMAAPGGDGDIKALVYVGSTSLTVVSESGAGTASRRFHLPSDVVLRQSECLIVRYDAALARWRSWGGWRDPADPIAQQAGLFDLSGEASADGIAFTATAPSSVTSYVPGRIFIFTAPVTNVGSTTTLNINGLGAASLSDASGVALVANTLGAGQTYLVQQYSTTSLRMLDVDKSEVGYDLMLSNRLMFMVGNVVKAQISSNANGELLFSMFTGGVLTEVARFDLGNGFFRALKGIAIGATAGSEQQVYWPGNPQPYLDSYADDVAVSNIASNSSMYEFMDQSIPTRWGTRNPTT